MKRDQTPVCIVCQAEQAQPFHHERGYRLLKCADCGLVFLWPLPELADQVALHEGGLARGSQGEAREICSGTADSVAARRDQRMAIARQKWSIHIGALLPPEPGRLLEIGCGGGELMQAAGEDGWQPVGVEMSSSKARLARQLTGCEVRAGAFEELDWAGQSFEAVVMIDVISHVPDPRRFLAGVSEVLAPGGVLVLETGNGADLKPHQMGVIRRDWGLPEHIFFYNASILTGLLGALGLELIASHERYCVDAFAEQARLLARAGIRTRSSRLIGNRVGSALFKGLFFWCLSKRAKSLTLAFHKPRAASRASSLP